MRGSATTVFAVRARLPPPVVARRCVQHVETDTHTHTHTHTHTQRLRLPADMPLKQKRNIVEDVINVLDLTRLKHVVVGSPEKRGISGGQKKRGSCYCATIGNVPLSATRTASLYTLNQLLRHLHPLFVCTARRHIKTQ